LSEKKDQVLLFFKCKKEKQHLLENLSFGEPC